MSRKIISLVLSLCFIFQQTGFAQAAAVELNLSGYFARMASSMDVDSFRPVHLRYFSYDNLNNSFKLLLDKGDFEKTTPPKASTPEASELKLKEETKELLSYFLIGLTLPNDKFWVNLRPDSPEQVIDFNLEETDIGKIMLEADLRLKKDTAQLTSPNTPEGREYWMRLYKKAEEIYGTENITIPTLTRPWIVPNEIIVRETKDSAYIYKATLKVMLEQDYLKNVPGAIASNVDYTFKDSRSKALNEYSTQLIKELIIPKLTKEVNLSRKYASLRQVYYSLILSRWFKSRFYGQSGVYASLIDKNDLTNLTSKQAWSKTTYFNEYKRSFAEGEYNIQEPVHTPSGQVIRSYFSGGIGLAGQFNLPGGKMPQVNLKEAKLTGVYAGKEGIDLARIIFGGKNNNVIYSGNPGLNQALPDLEDAKEGKTSKDKTASSAITYSKPIGMENARGFYREIEKQGNVIVLSMNMRNPVALRGVFRAARETGAPVVIQRSISEFVDNYLPMDLAMDANIAAQQEGFTGSWLLKLDHATVSEDSPEAIAKVIKFVEMAKEAGFGTFAIDCSKLVDFSKPTENEQQKRNYEVTAEIVKKTGIENSAWEGEIGEIVGDHNEISTLAEAIAFLEGIESLGVRLPVLLAIHNGSEHGNAPGMKIDLARTKEIADYIFTRWGIRINQHGITGTKLSLFPQLAAVGIRNGNIGTHWQNIVWSVVHKMQPEITETAMAALGLTDLDDKTQKKTWDKKVRGQDQELINLLKPETEEAIIQAVYESAREHFEVTGAKSVAKASSAALKTVNDAENLINGITKSTVNDAAYIADIEAKLREADLPVLQIVSAHIYNSAVELDEGSLKLSEDEAAVVYAKRNLLAKIIGEKQKILPQKPAMTVEQVETKINAINKNTINSPDDIAAIESALRSAELDALLIVSMPIYNDAISLNEGRLSLSQDEKVVLLAKYNLLTRIIEDKRKSLPQKQEMTAIEVQELLNGINAETINNPDDIAAIEAKLRSAPLGAIEETAKNIFVLASQVKDGKFPGISQAQTAVVYKKRDLLSQVIADKAKTASSPITYSWQDFEQNELLGREISQQKRNLSKPVKIAFNVDTFTSDPNVTLLGGINRIFDAIFRLLDGNPNFAPVAIFLGDYADGMRSSKERLAEFLNSNPALGNSKYKVKLSGNKLIINGMEIALYNSLATAKLLNDLGVEYLVEATRQGTDKSGEELAQDSRIAAYLRSCKNLKVVVMAPEEDKGQLSAAIPVVNRVNTAEILNPDSRKIVMAEPITTVTSIMAKVVTGAVQAQNPRSRVSPVKIEAIRTDRQGNRLIDITSKTRAGLALNKIITGDAKAEAEFASLVTDTGAISGANAIKLILRVDGFIDNFTADMVNAAFRDASKGSFSGLIDIKGDTVSSFERFNQKTLIFIPVTQDAIKVVREPGRPAHRTIELRGFYTETGYAKQILDLITQISMYNGNKATAEDTASIKAPEGTIARTPDRIRLQVVSDGEAVPVVLNSARGRMAINILRVLWDDPNFKLVAINGVRAKGEAVTAELIEFDQVFGEAPFAVEVTADKKHFKFTDKEERVIPINNQTTETAMQAGVLGKITRTPHGNLFIELDKNSRKISSLRLHGESVRNINVIDNQNGTFSAQGRLSNGSTAKVTYSKGKGDTLVLISAGVRKQIIIPFTNVRADKSAYAQRQGENVEDFLLRVDNYNRELSRKIMTELPQLNEGALFLEASGQLIESTKLNPFIIAGAGRGLISAPAKATIPGRPAADVTVVPAVNTENFISVENLLEIASCASCSTNASGTGARALLDMVSVMSGYFDTIHAITNTQGSQFGDILKNLERSVDARGNIVYSSTGAAKELGRAIAELLNSVSGVALRVGNDDGSLINFDLQVMPRQGQRLPTAEEINKRVKFLTELPEIEGGLKGFLGYGIYNTSLEIIGKEFGGIFDPSMTHVNEQTGSVSIGIWYDNERGYVGQYIKLALLTALHKRELEKNTEIIAQDVVADQGAYTGRVSVAGAEQAGATGAIIGLGSIRKLEEDANLNRLKSRNVNAEINKALKKALLLGLPVPILNVYLSANELSAGRAIDSINRQVTEAFKDIPAEDIARVTVSLEAAKEDGLDFTGYSNAIRNAVAGYVTRTSGDNMQLGANVSDKIRIIIKLNDTEKNNSFISALAKEPGIDGLILPTRLASRSFKEIGSLAKEISEGINTPDKRNNLNQRNSPRFLLGISADHLLTEEDIRAITGSEVDYHYLQLAIAPLAVQFKEIASIQKGEKVIAAATPPADKAVVRVLLQNVTRGYKEGFLNLEDAGDLIKKLGVHDILLAHSEVIDLTGITDEDISILARISHELKAKGELSGNVIIAVGEVSTDYEAGRSKEVVTNQVINRTSGLTAEQIINTVIAYEPRWAIGSGRTPSMEEIQSIHQAIRNAIKAKFGLEASGKIRIIYGGSVTQDNAEDILRLRDVDGALIGGESTYAERFRKVVAAGERQYDVKKGKWGLDRKMYIAGNHKAYQVKNSYEEFARLNTDVDKTKVEVALGPELSKIHELTGIYSGDPLKNIVSIDQLGQPEISDKIWFAREDWNVPIDDATADPANPDTWKITSKSRIEASKETIDYVCNKGGIYAVYIHFEPKGQNVKGPQSVRFMLPAIEQTLGRKVTFVSDILGSARQNALKTAKPGDVILFENIRLNKAIAEQEKSKDPKVRNALAKRLFSGPSSENPLARVGGKINNGFGVMHRAQASVDGEVAGVPMLAGLCLVKELKYGAQAINNAKHPVAIVFGGGPKIAGKIPVLENVIKWTLSKGDTLFIYGGAAIPFLMAQDPGFEPGKSKNLVSDETVEAARRIIELAESEGVGIVLPKDFVVADSLPVDEYQTVFTNTVRSIPPTKGYYDIGPETRKEFKGAMIDEKGKSKFSTIITNGPAGIFEYEQFRAGTNDILDVISQATKAGALTLGVQELGEQETDVLSISAGADTGYALELLGQPNGFSFVSTGGGAFLELLQGLGLPGVKVLEKAAGKYSYHLNPSLKEGFAKARKLVSDYAEVYAEQQAVSSPLTPALTPDFLDRVSDILNRARIIIPLGKNDDFQVKLQTELGIRLSEIQRMNDLQELIVVTRAVNSLYGELNKTERYEVRAGQILPAKSKQPGSSSSAITTQAPETTGGIDFKHKAMAGATTYETLGSFAGLDFNLPKLSSQALFSFNLDKEQSDITRAIDNGILVSGQRIKEFMAASSAKGELEQRRDTVLTWLAKLGILEETQCCSQESSREYREALVIADSAVI